MPFDEAKVQIKEILSGQGKKDAYEKVIADLKIISGTRELG